MEVPNLDNLSTQDLLGFQSQCKNSKVLAKRLGTTTDVVSILKQYAEFTLKARNQRLKGKIALALHLERTCEELYNSIPESMRW